MRRAVARRAGAAVVALASTAFLGCREAAPAPGDAAAPPASPIPAAAAAPQAIPAAESRDVVLVTIDTLRADAVGFASEPAPHGRAETPVLTALAAGGRVFPRAYAHDVVTLPSHASILSGLYPPGHGVRENSGFVLAETVPTLATLLQGAGWATGAFVGAFALDRRFGLDRGFDVYDDEYGGGRSELRFAERRGDEVVGRALAWWRAEAGRPRFLWVHLYDPHAPYAPPEPWASRYRDRPYLGEIAAADAFLAPLLEPWLAGDEPPGLVAVTADHGEALGDHGESTHGLFAYDATLKVPLVLWGAGIAPGRDERVAGHVDLLPTVLERLGLDLPPGLPGRSLLDPPQASRSLYFEALTTYLNRGWAPLRGGVSADGWKAIELPLPELYDLGGDPAESRNRVDDERRRYRTVLDALPPEEPWPPSPARRVTAEEAARLRSLGYLAAAGPATTRFGEEDDPKRLVDLDERMQASIVAYLEGDVERAVVLAREVVARRPAMAAGHTHLASMLREAGALGEALEVLAGAAAQGLGSEELMRQWGLALAEAGRPAEAVEVLAPFAASPDLATVDAYGLALSDAGRQEEAAAVFARVLARDPNDLQALETLGVVELRRDAPAAAEATLRRAVELDPGRGGAWNSLGVALSLQGRDGEAIAAWERAVAADPRLLDALYNLGLTAARRGDAPRARTALARWLEATAGRPGPDRERAEAALRSLR